ncbi:MAG: ECF transporter S component [Lachnospiraceae bacterium]|nr:ECF transporter S component [Lachnospiraceae bacterium]
MKTKTMTNAMKRAWTMPCLSLKAKTMATIIAVISAVVLPQLLHTVGLAMGSGSALGEIFLPMHLPILLVGLFAGPYAGLIAGVLAPIISYSLTGMPAMAMLPFITIEVAIYGLGAGFFRNLKMPTFGKVLLAQILGRTVRAMAILAAVYVLGDTVVKPAIILTSIKTGFAGIVLQWILIVAVVYLVRKASEKEVE